MHPRDEDPSNRRPRNAGRRSFREGNPWDYPYLEPEDIRACLLYAARATDHVVLTAAGDCWLTGRRGR
jgi:hypothetical protein